MSVLLLLVMLVPPVNLGTLVSCYGVPPLPRARRKPQACHGSAGISWDQNHRRRCDNRKACTVLEVQSFSISSPFRLAAMRHTVVAGRGE